MDFNASLDFEMCFPTYNLVHVPCNGETPNPHRFWHGDQHMTSMTSATNDVS